MTKTLLDKSTLSGWSLYRVRPIYELEHRFTTVEEVMQMAYIKGMHDALQIEARNNK